MFKLYVSSTVSFWVLVGVVWLIGVSAPQTLAEPAAAGKSYSLAEVAAHAKPTDCWMAIHGKVYDVTAYLPDHPSRPEAIEAWCGREASNAFDTKTKGRPHSAAATRMLETYRIGELKKTP
jgi:cytochrome b involved in lipid metabolism